MTVKPSTTDTLILDMSEDAWSGDAEFTITVDGVQVGGTQTVTAANASGQTQAFTVTGDFGTGAHSVAIHFVNPATGGTPATTRNLYLDSLNLDGTAMTLDANVTGTTTATITAAAPPPRTDTLTVNVAEDAWDGNAEFLVLVDGVQVGGTQTTTALHGQGQSQNITLTGDFGAGSHTVAVEFINDAWGGSSAEDRNLYVNSVTYDGTTTTLNAPLYSDGSTTPVTVSDVATVTRGAVTAAPDTLVLYMAEDAYLGNATFSVTVNGQAVGGVMTATALHGSAQEQAFTLTGNWGTGPVAVAVTYLNDANGSGGDRNLYVDAITYNSFVQADATASLLNNGTANFTVAATAADVLVLYMAEDAYLGNAQFTVTVNGQAVGGVMTATALHGSGQQQAFTLDGNWGPGPVSVAVTYLNDVWGGSSAADRNLYVDAITYNGFAQANDSAPLFNDGTASFTVAATPIDTLILTMAEDAYLGNATFSVTVNGHAVGGVMTVTALHGSGQQQAFTLTGNWGNGPVSVAVTYLNDASGTGGNRNLYVDSIAYNGVAQTNASAALDTDGTTSFSVTAPVTDSLVLYMAEDAYLGNAEFSVTVNGQAVGGVMTVTALHDAGQEQAFTLPGDFGTGPVNVAVTFLNDASGPGGDRNLYVDGITYHGYAQANDTAPIYSDGTANFSVQEPGAVDTLVLYVSEDYYLANAEFSVTVDGNPVGGILTATGSHAAGGTTPMTLTGVFGPGPHTVVVTFLNDANGGNSSLDRNLYVSGIDYNGVYTGVNASLYYTGASSTTVVGVPGVAPTVPLADMSAPGTFQYVGVNLSGLEFGGPVYPGVLNKDYVVPTDAEIDYYKSEGMNIIRLPFDWERLQPVMNGPLNQTYLGLIDGVVAYAAKQGMTVDLDVHNYGSYYGNEVGTSAVPNSAFANLWSQLATHFASTPNVLFGLMNEPQETSATQWVGSANAAIAAIRAAGANQEILVAGIDNGGGESWTTSDNASAMLGIVDPKMNFAYEIHQYLNGGGNLPVTTVDGPPTLGVSDLTAVTQWAAATGSKLFLGEFGAGTDAASLTAMKNMLTYMGQNTNVWQGLTEWGGGPWWGNYGFATDPVNGVTQPQINLLKTYE